MFFRVFKNSMQYLYVCTFSGPGDEKNKNETKIDFKHMISEYFVCIFPQISIFIKIEDK